LIANRMVDPQAAQAGRQSVQAFGVRPPVEQRKKLGELLIEMGLLTAAQLAQALQSQAGTSKRLGEWLTANARVSEADLLKALSRQTGIPCISLRPGLYEAAAAALLPKEAAKRLRVLPLFKVNDTLTLATADPLAVPVLDEVKEITGCKLRLVLATPEDITKAQFDAYSGNALTPALAENLPTDLEVVAAPSADL